MLSRHLFMGKAPQKRRIVTGGKSNKQAGQRALSEPAHERLLLELSQIRKVLRATDGAFVSDQLFLAENEYWDATWLSGGFPGECLIARDAGEAGQQADASPLP
jgi:hypothetical protein